MRTRQKVQRFDQLTAHRKRLNDFISTMEANNAVILSYDQENLPEGQELDEDVVLAKEKLLGVLNSKKETLAVLDKEWKEFDYFFKKSKIDLDKYRNTVEYIGEE